MSPTPPAPSFARELRTSATLAAPLVLGHLSTGLIGFVDSVIAGHHGTRTLAAVAVGTALFWLPMMVPMGTLMAFPPAVSELDGAGRRTEIAPLFRQALWLAAMLGVVLFAFLSVVTLALEPMGIAPEIRTGARAFLEGIRWGVPGFTLYLTMRYLSLQYFAGHRVRFVSPVRLFVFLAIVTFFVAQFALDFGDTKIGFNGGDDEIASAKTVQEVEQRRREALAELAKAKRDTAQTPGVSVGLDAAATAISAQADRRIEELQDARKGPAAASDAKPEAPPPGAVRTDDEIQFNGKPWDPETNPIDIGWLPDIGNRKLNEMVGHAKENIRRMQQDPNLFKDAVLSAVPSTLFVLMPVFALMLKIAYAFRRRLYMEHLIVALHSHAFLCLSLLAMFLLMAFQDAVAPRASGLFKLFETALWIWMPTYLLVMQKRVYGQGWLMTLLKYCVLGVCYFVLLSLGAAFTMLASLVWM